MRRWPKHAYHLLILDEAQYVKNAASRGAAAIRQLDARHRLCLTGTPLENNLGELWAQFDFLLPGFLGSQQDFNKRWRNPIEKFGDDTRRELLARRLRPFMLRRKKDQVATELPPKTQIVTTVELEAAQRDLYETVRTAMQKKVREAIAGQGLARSHIIVLDALLKLRQVCCDPRLVKLRGAKAAQSAKLAMLMTMLPALLDEGRKVLLFSQFTAMLDLIAEALDAAGIPYVMLTGETGDRSLPVQRFQGGEVPLFLISLKAGGVGLNLTAADTVIHYDPWWNPAAENQATDRAHRLGQDKPVFVYKLIVAGSIEEKIVALQERKAALPAPSWTCWHRTFRSSSCVSRTSPMAASRTAFPTRCCRKTANSPRRPCASMARISASPGTATSTAASSSTTTAASLKAITWSACWRRPRWRATRAARSCMTRA
jgi:SNF2 family DNA or RNA helicase